MATSMAVQALENRLPKMIGPKVHGVIDYAHAAFFVGAGLFFWKKNKRAGVTALATGGLVLAEALVTDYPLGVTPLISFRAHGQLDAAFASLSLLAPQLFGFKDSGAATLYRVNAVVEAAIVGLTDFESAGGSKPIADTVPIR